MQQENAQMERESIEQNNRDKEEIEAVRAVSKTKNNKIFKKFMLRIQKDALLKWRQRIEEFRGGKTL